MRLFSALALAAVSLSPAAPASDMVSADLRPPTVAAWDDYVRVVEARVETELQTAKPFLVLERLPQAERQKAAASLAAGSVFITRVPGPNLKGPASDIPGGLVHHWLGVVQVPGVRVDDVLAFVQRYDDSPRYFQDVIASKLGSRDGDVFEVDLKLRREKSVLGYRVSKVYNTTHRVVYRRLDPTHAASRSVTTRIAEVEDAGQPGERERPVGQDAGYLWRLNSYWRFVETDGGVTVECESISLSRGIPTGIGWIAGPIVEAIARESVEQTLGSIRKGVKP
jgi:opacity protein-like surface antigen